MERQAPFSRVILHVDMDAFFASVEQREHREYRGKPVVVGADPRQGKGRGVVAACSYEARRYGIRSAMPIGRAYRLCPQAVFVRPNGAAYAHVSRAVMEILKRYTDLLEAVSIDEAFLDVSGSLQMFGSAVELAMRIKSDIWKEQSLTCSVGIAPNKFLAKVASDMQKPDGWFEVKPGCEEEFLRDLPVSRIWGVGPESDARLRSLGIATVGDVAQRSREFWERCLGKRGVRLWELAHGRDDRPVETGVGFSSLSQERTFEADTAEIAVLKETLLQLSEQLARRARQHGSRARCCSLKLRYADFSTFHRQKTLPQSTDDAQVIYAVAWELLERFFPLQQKVRLLGVGMSRFEPWENMQMGLFDESRIRKRRLDAAVDAVLAKFGTGSLRKAALLGRPDDEDNVSSFLRK
ncbi:MAG: DNA polymerase IV [Acidobacteria bacterium]|nr:DNA polymerase IV [Acidobacteriota bacterium]